MTHHTKDDILTALRSDEGDELLQAFADNTGADIKNVRRFMETQPGYDESIANWVLREMHNDDECAGDAADQFMREADNADAVSAQEDAQEDDGADTPSEPVAPVTAAQEQPAAKPARRGAGVKTGDKETIWKRADEVVRLYEGGMSARGIARKFNLGECARQGILHILKARGVAVRYGGTRPVVVDKPKSAPKPAPKTAPVAPRATQSVSAPTEPKVIVPSATGVPLAAVAYLKETLNGVEKQIASLKADADKLRSAIRALR